MLCKSPEKGKDANMSSIDRSETVTTVNGRNNGQNLPPLGAHPAHPVNPV
jgi:hypothetical protein